MTSSLHSTTPERAPGEIITFYSYKGGTGRSMALANVACLLAAQTPPTGRGVLMVDWDLEAPGLHRYFHDSFSGLAEVRANIIRRFGIRKTAEGAEDYVNQRLGLIDLFLRLDKATPADGYEDELQAAEHAERLAAEFSVTEYALQLQVPKLYLLKAGCFDDEYSNRVNNFDWQGLHRRSPWLIRSLAARLAGEFDYVLIDSRTGLTDTSGICTVLMPEKLVVVFTPNRQSFTGVENLVRKASKYRKESDDLRPLIVFPLTSRIESSRDDLRKLWRFGDAERDIVGYQPLFERLLGEVYNLPPEQCDLSEYFDEVQIQQTADYAYGEEVAVRVEQQTDRFSLTRSFQTFTERLVESEGPWSHRPEERPEPEGDPKAAMLAKADAFYWSLSPEHRQNALRVLARLVTVSPTGEGSRDTLGHAKYAEIESGSWTINGLTEAGVVAFTNDAYSEEPAFEITDESFVREWPPLREWIERNRDFLFWRQKLKTYIGDWELGGRSTADLLSGSALAAAKRYAAERAKELNAAENEYVQRSIRSDRLNRLVRLITVILLTICVPGAFAWQYYRSDVAKALVAGLQVLALLSGLVLAWIFFSSRHRRGRK